ncbi:MAG: hypothetical protein ABEI96_07395 [Haloarculaceae archaeon]
MSADESQSHYFPDGSTVELSVETNDAAIRNSAAGTLRKRMHRLQQRFPLEEGSTALFAYRRFAPDSSDDRSTTTYTLPSGRVTATIETKRRDVHGYLNYLVSDAVAYTHVVDIEAVRATILAIALLGVAIALALTGRYVLSAPLFGAGGIVTLYVAVYWLAVYGIFLDLSRQPEPTEP